MKDFDKTYNEINDMILENSFKSLATAGMLLGFGALGAGINADAISQGVQQTISRVHQPTDQELIRKVTPFTAESEGFRDRVYLDSEKIPSIGYGFNLSEPHVQQELAKLGYSVQNLINGKSAIRKSDADGILAKELNIALLDAKKFVRDWNSLDPMAKFILVDMSYNLGYNRLSTFKNFKSALDRHDYATASKEMVNSKWYRQVGDRSKRLVDLMNSISTR